MRGSEVKDDPGATAAAENQKPDVSGLRPPPGRRFARRAALPLRRPAWFENTLAETSVPGRSRARDALLRRLLALADLFSAAAAIAFCILVLGSSELEVGIGMVAVLPLVLLVSKVIGLYDRDEAVLSKSTLDELPALFQLATFYTLLVWLIEGPMVGGRSQIVGLWGALFLFAALSRTVARATVRRATPPERCAIVGSESTYRYLAKKFVDSKRLNVELAGCIRLNRAGAAPSSEQICQQLDALQVDRVILALRWETEGDTALELITNIKASGCKVSLMPRMLEVVGSAVEFDDIDGIPVLGVRRFGLSPSSATVKRAFDIVLSIWCLVLAAPVMLVAALLIWLDSPGGALFRQTRIGRDGSAFQMLKFRTMVADAESLQARPAAPQRSGRALQDRR